MENLTGTIEDGGAFFDTIIRTDTTTDTSDNVGDGFGTLIEFKNITPITNLVMSIARGDNIGGWGVDNLSFNVPEPTTLLLLGIGLIGLAGLSRRKFIK